MVIYRVESVTSETDDCRKSEPVAMPVRLTRRQAKVFPSNNSDALGECAFLILLSDNLH